MEQMTEKFSIVTDTRAVFDLARLKHRLEDSADWWSLPEDGRDKCG